jgi:hypothetical protein
MYVGTVLPVLVFVFFSMLIAILVLSIAHELIGGGFLLSFQWWGKW